MCSAGVEATVAETAEIAEAQCLDVGGLKAALPGARPTSLLQRFIEPDEIAALITYRAGPASSATNGSALRADRGVLTTIL